MSIRTVVFRTAIEIVQRDIIMNNEKQAIIKNLLLSAVYDGLQLKFCHQLHVSSRSPRGLKSVGSRLGLLL